MFEDHLLYFRALVTIDPHYTLGKQYDRCVVTMLS